jgi:hypothetical protein
MSESTLGRSPKYKDVGEVSVPIQSWLSSRESAWWRTLEVWEETIQGPWPLQWNPACLHCPLPSASPAHILCPCPARSVSSSSLYARWLLPLCPHSCCSPHLNVQVGHSFEIMRLLGSHPCTKSLVWMNPLSHSLWASLCSKLLWHLRLSGFSLSLLGTFLVLSCVRHCFPILF